MLCIQLLSYGPAKTDFLIVWNQASERSSILKKNKRHILVMGAVNAIGEIACRVCDGDGGSFHENQIVRYYLENTPGAEPQWPRASKLHSPHLGRLLLNSSVRRCRAPVTATRPN